MNYTIFIGVVIGTWILTVIIAFIFAKYISNADGIYNKRIVDRGNNIFTYGLIGLIAIFIRNSSQNKITYYLMIAVLIIFGMLFLADTIKALFTIGTTLILMFDKNYSGLEDAGKLGDWIFISSMIIENGLMGFITLNMFNTIF